ncbi:MAG: tRNA epoxyqueuosine(34) reductase QueG [Elusimicrobia bacterium]|nr:tRNA epoxyqueuosine(34) reductase QueG [Elusimicrobiota bacterium]
MPLGPGPPRQEGRPDGVGHLAHRRPQLQDPEGQALLLTPEALAAALKRRALDAGADLAGIAPAAASLDAAAYDAWVGAGMHGTMSYMARNQESRRDIRAWRPEAKSVLVCAFSYGGLRPAPKPGDGRLARYAVREDYHPLLKARMAELLEWVKTAVPGAAGLPFCDTSPLLERSYARRAGLGWQGKNAMMISSDLGSYYLLAGLALDLDLPSDEPEADHCGSCRRCLDACPTDAFPRERVLDASRCIAYFTIENRGPVPEEFREGVGHWAFGCDVCQEVCPWNRFERPGLALPPPLLPLEIPLEELATLDDEAFRRKFKNLPMSRSKRRGLLRNALLAMGNSRQERFRALLEGFAADGDEMIAKQASWSLERLSRTRQ